jgi:hypothetical protein
MFQTLQSATKALVSHLHHEFDDLDGGPDQYQLAGLPVTALRFKENKTRIFSVEIPFRHTEIDFEEDLPNEEAGVYVWAMFGLKFEGENLVSIFQVVDGEKRLVFDSSLREWNLSNDSFRFMINIVDSYRGSISEAYERKEYEKTGVVQSVHTSFETGQMIHLETSNILFVNFIK